MMFLLGIMVGLVGAVILGLGLLVWIGGGNG